MRRGLQGEQVVFYQEKQVVKTTYRHHHYTFLYLQRIARKKNTHKKKRKHTYYGTHNFLNVTESLYNKVHIFPHFPSLLTSSPSLL